MNKTERKWRAELSAFRMSGFMRCAFCERRQLPLSSFCHWQQRLRVELGEVEATSPTIARLIPIEVLRSADVRYEVRLTNGRQLVVPGDFDASAVRALIALLEVPAC